MDERSKALRDLLYGLARIVILIIADFFAAIISRTVILAVIGNIVSSEKRTFNEGYLSHIAFAILLVMISLLFFDDGKRHAAYSRHDTVTASIVVITCSAAYFVPVLFLKYAEDDKVLKFYEWFYLPVEWINSFMRDTQMSVLIGAIIMCVAFILFYWLGGRYYYYRLNKRIMRDKIRRK